MHTDDVYYNFDLSDDKCAQFSERDYEVASYMALAFVNFARTGNPNINNSQVNIKSIFLVKILILILIYFSYLESLG